MDIPSQTRAPGRRRTASVALVFAVLFAAFAVPGTALADPDPTVLVSEVSNAGPDGSADEIIELTNYGDAPADLNGWGAYRCTAVGSRAYDPQIPLLEGVTLAPGETYLIANRNGTVPDADAYYDVSLANAGFGVRLEDERRAIADAVAVYASPTDSECSLDDEPLPNDLNGVRNQTWQRTGHTGTDADDFIRAERTAGEPNATEPDEGVQPGDVLVSELTNLGPNGSADDFVEFANYGDETADIGGWEFYRCWGSGRTTPGSLQATVPAGTRLAPGEVFVAAHDSVEVPEGVPHARYPVSLSNAGFGAMLVDTSGTVRDSVGVYETDGVHQASTGSPCTRGEALPNRLDGGSGQSWQRTDATGDNAADFVKGERTIGELTEPVEVPDPEPVETGVRVTELVNAGPGGGADEFFELANLGEEAVSLEGWSLHRCQGDTRRNPGRQAEIPSGTVLEPGETFTAVHSGSDYEGDASYDTGFAAEGFGLMVLTGDGGLADSVGVYDDGYSPCTRGLSILNLVDTADGETLQRVDSTRRNSRDFTAAPASPGTLPDDLRRPADVEEGELDDVAVEPAPRPLSPEASDEVDGTSASLTAAASHTTGGDSEVGFIGAEAIDLSRKASRVFTGVSEDPVPQSRKIAEEEARKDGWDAPVVTEAVDGYPFQRFELTLAERPKEDFSLTWSGSSTGTNELQMYAWNRHADRWDPLTHGGGVTGGAITLTGEASASDHVRGRTADILVIDGPAVGAAFSDDGAEPNRSFKDPAEYDVAFGHVSDTQFLSEGYRSTYTDMVKWLAANDEGRGIAYTSHTGDVVENWLNGTHSERRAVDEFEFASEVMSLLEESDHPYGILPGNHDNKWGRDGGLYEEYFPAERFEDEPWYGGSWKDGDAQNHYDVVEEGGARFLFLSLGYLGGDESVEWANEVIAAHPDHNVVLATHEYLNTDGSLSTPDSYRWTSMADRYWSEIVEPNANVFMVLSGHHYGTATNVKEGVGGDEDRKVVEMMANYQGFQDGDHFDTGFLRLLQFDLDASLMAVNTYSPSLGEHNAWNYGKDEEGLPEYTDADDEFTVEVSLTSGYDKRVATESLVPHGAPTDLGGAAAGDGESATVVWDGLTPCGTYLWYASAEADGRSALSRARTVAVPARDGRGC
ncbi:lamin tail domain-containing protein [Salininema proteolyticum]|uniref:Lamin tail domain-containing protein n=1 Tax=Salininema proteolyticum TaxID=1607685 RepID=A0ABV8U4W0_9ACTN